MIRANRLTGAIGQLPLAEDSSAINWGNPLTRGLVSCFIPSTRGGCMIDLVSGLQVPSDRGARAFNSSLAGRVGDCAASGGRGFRVATPTRLRLTLPLSIGWAGAPLGAHDASPPLITIYHNNTGSPPYVSYSLGLGGTSGAPAALQYNNGGSFTALNATTNISALYNKRTTILGTLQSGSQIIYTNGIAEASTSSAISNPTYGASTYIAIGVVDSDTRNANVWCGLAPIWTRVLSPAEALSFAQNPWQILTPGMRLSLGVITLAQYRWSRLWDERIMSGGING